MTIPRYQRILFLVLISLSALMAAFLVRVHRRNVQRLNELTSTSASPIEVPPATSSVEPVTFLLANDQDGTIRSEDRSVALPTEDTLRLRAILERLFSEYGLPDSKHPVHAEGAAVSDVFFVPLRLDVPVAGDTKAAAPTALGTKLTNKDEKLAVINLHQNLVDAHPSGVQVETLTLLSLLGTVHANFPQVSQVQFLVEGKSKETLAGHVALDRVFPSTDTTIRAGE